MRIGDHQQLERGHALGRFRNTGDGVAGVAEHHHRLHIVALPDFVLRQQHRVEPAGERDAGGLHHLLRRSWDRTAPGSSCSRLPRRGSNASRRLRRGRSRTAASPHRGRCRWRPARCRGRGRCWRRCRACRHCRWRAARCSSPARWRCRRCAGSGPCTRSASTAFASRTSWRRARAARPARRKCSRRLPACTSRFPCAPRPCRRRAA